MQASERITIVARVKNMYMVNVVYVGIHVYFC